MPRKRATTRVTGVAERKMTGMSIDSAFKYFISAKKAENLRPNTIEGYAKTWRYFTNWLKERGHDVQEIGDITPDICREYVL